MKYYLNIIKVTFYIYKRNVDLSMELLVVLLYMSILILLGSDLENVQNLVIIHAIWPDRYKTKLAETVFILKWDILLIQKTLQVDSDMK